jgi:hypothetical protein
VTDTTCSATAGWTGLDVAERPADGAGEAWLPGDANPTIRTPAASTSAALLAVSAAPRLFNGTGRRRAWVRGQIRLAAEAPLLASNDCCLRNHPDRDTLPSPQRDFTAGQIFLTRTPEAAKVR